MFVQSNTSWKCYRAKPIGKQLSVIRVSGCWGPGGEAPGGMRVIISNTSLSMGHRSRRERLQRAVMAEDSEDVKLALTLPGND